MGTFADVQRGLAVVLLSHPLDVGTIAWWAARARRSVWALLLLALAAAMILGLQLMGLGPHKLSAFAPDLALTLAAVGLCFCLPAALGAARHFPESSNHPRSRASVTIVRNTQVCFVHGDLHSIRRTEAARTAEAHQTGRYPAARSPSRTALGSSSTTCCN